MAGGCFRPEAEIDNTESRSAEVSSSILYRCKVPSRMVAIHSDSIAKQQSLPARRLTAAAKIRRWRQVWKSHLSEHRRFVAVSRYEVEVFLSQTAQ